MLGEWIFVTDRAGVIYNLSHLLNPAVLVRPLPPGDRPVDPLLLDRLRTRRPWANVTGPYADVGVVALMCPSAPPTPAICQAMRIGTEVTLWLPPRPPFIGYIYTLARNGGLLPYRFTVREAGAVLSAAPAAFSDDGIIPAWRMSAEATS